MNLLLIILFLTAFSFISNFFCKYYKIFVFLSVLIVISFYFSLSKNFFHTGIFYPTHDIYAYKPCGNYYNLLIDSLKEGKLYIAKINNLKNINPFDTSVYKDNVYIYFGLTPLLVFYIPFHLITGLYLTDKMLVFVLSGIFFLISLLILKIFLKETNLKIQPFIKILSIFLIGFCNYLPFLVIRGAIYEICILSAMICLFLSVITIYRLNTNKKHKYLFVFLLGSLLSFSVGARPQYILFIPIFYLAILYIECNKNNKITDFIVLTFLFFTPCIAYGIIIATYNYLRFDSFIEFGWKYQLNEYNQTHYFRDIKNILISIKYNFFEFPETGTKTVFSLVKSKGHSGGKELAAGIIYSFPLILNFVIILPFIKYTAKNKNIFICILLFLSIALINFITTGLIGGIIVRYVFEYLSIIVILSLFIFYYLLNKQKNHKTLFVLFNILFVIFFIFSVYINISFLFCEPNSEFFNLPVSGSYKTVIKFLF